MRKFIYIIVFLCFAHNAYPATYNWYFSDGGDDSTGDGSIGSPWRTLGKARTQCNALLSADIATFYFNKGDTFTGTNSGFDWFYADADVVNFDAYGSGADPIWDFGVDFSAGDPLTGSRNRWDAIIRFAGDSSGSYVRNITMQYHHGAGISNGAAVSSLTVEYCTIHNMGMHAISVGPNNCTIRYNDVDLLQRLEEYDYHVGMWGGAIAIQGSGTGNLVAYNRVNRCYGEGIFINANGIIRDNIIGITYSNSIYMPAHYNQAGATYVMRNIIYGVNSDTVTGTVSNYRGIDNGFCILAEVSGITKNQPIYIYGNVSINRRWNFIIRDALGHASSYQWGDIYLYNNTGIDAWINNVYVEDPNSFSNFYAYRNALIYYDQSSATQQVYETDNFGNASNVYIAYNSYYPHTGIVDSDWQDNMVTGNPLLATQSGYQNLPYDTDTALFDISDIIPAYNSPLNDSGDTTLLSYGDDLLTASADFTGDLNSTTIVIASTQIDGYPEIGAITESGPVLSSISPTSQQECVSDPQTVNLSFTTDVNAYCRESTNVSHTLYTDMSNQLDNGEGTTSHNEDFSQACGGSTVHYVICNTASDGSGYSSGREEITIDVASQGSVTAPPLSIEMNTGGISIQDGGELIIIVE